MTTNATRSILFLMAIFSMIVFTAYAAEGLKVVEGNGQAILGEDTTMSQGKARALNNARRDALEGNPGSLRVGKRSGFTGDPHCVRKSKSRVVTFWKEGINLCARIVCMKTRMNPATSKPLLLPEGTLFI
jgi:hypothetical protein